MITVYKYELSRGVNDVPLRGPESSGIVRHVGFDPRGERCVWIEVDTDLKTEQRAFVIFGTGHPLPEKGIKEFCGTFVEGPFVWHIYELDPASL